MVSQCASISLAAYPQHGETQNELITRADAALYKAKHGGRDRAILASV
ncbi:MAG: diguanylate cyclase [Bdellovibrionales bacterium]|nr:diguanylate cyclase [Bdellovibrionales bacterium]